MIRIKVEIVEQLHASNATDNVGSTALMYACEKGYIDITQVLLEKGANIPSNADSIIHDDSSSSEEDSD